MLDNIPRRAAAIVGASDSTVLHLPPFRVWDQILWSLRFFLVGLNVLPENLDKPKENSVGNLNWERKTLHHVESRASNEQRHKTPCFLIALRTRLRLRLSCRDPRARHGSCALLHLPRSFCPPHEYLLRSLPPQAAVDEVRPRFRIFVLASFKPAQKACDERADCINFEKRIPCGRVGVDEAQKCSMQKFFLEKAIRQLETCRNDILMALK